MKQKNNKELLQQAEKFIRSTGINLPGRDENTDDDDDFEDKDINHRQQIFVEELVAHGNRRIAYQKAYPGASNAASYTASWRLLQKPAVLMNIMQELLIKKSISDEVIRKHFNNKVADIAEKRAVLAQIIRGEMVTEKETDRDGKTTTIKYKNDPKERIRAIIIDNKLEEDLMKSLEIPDRGMKYIE